MSPPLVRCASCEREWHSATMADGLRGLDACPRCGGALVFGASAAATAPAASESQAGGDDTAPHLVLGVPRR